MGEYLLLMKFQGVSPETMRDEHAQSIHDEYMGKYAPDAGQVGPPARTRYVVELAGPYDFAVWYEGPEASRVDLENMVTARAAQAGGNVDLVTLDVVGDITDQF